MTISPAETTHDERVGSTLYASIWLIFLAFPVVGLLRSAHGPAAMAVGAARFLLRLVAMSRVETCHSPTRSRPDSTITARGESARCTSPRRCA